jgi:N-acetyltransferase
MWINAENIEGRFVILEPLRKEHIAGLKLAVQDGEAWQLWFANVPHPDEMADYVNSAISAAETGDIAFAVRLKTTNQLVGTTRYYHVDSKNKRAMIGYTWYAASVRRSAVNTECKLLLLNKLFDVHGAIAAEFRTHVQNTASRAAIERLGAKLDGILRQHQILKDGSIRDTAVYSIIAAEWPTVKASLQNKLTSSLSQVNV